MSHKGDWSRVNDHKSYQNNYDEIFRRKTDKPEDLQIHTEEGSRSDQQGEGKEADRLPARDVQADT
jgi:hypothetical protein